MRSTLTGCLPVLLSMFLSAANAAPVLFDFESQSTAGVFTSITDTNQGLTLTLTRPGSAFLFQNISAIPGAPANYGQRTLSPFNDPTSNTAFVGNVSNGITSISIEFGDFVLSDQDTVILEAFSGLGATGTLLASSSTTCCSNGIGFAGSNLSVAAFGINSIRFIGGSTAFPNSVYFDNILVNADLTVPEPSSVFLVVLAIAAAGTVSHRKLNSGAA